MKALELERKRLKEIGWRQMFLELKEKLPHSRGKKRSKLAGVALQVRQDKITKARLASYVALASIALNIFGFVVYVLPAHSKAVAYKKLVVANTKKQAVINHLNEENAYLSGEMQRDWAKLKGKYKEAIAGAEQAEAFYNKLIAAKMGQ